MWVEFPIEIVDPKEIRKLQDMGVDTKPDVKIRSVFLDLGQVELFYGNITEDGGECTTIGMRSGSEITTLLPLTQTTTIMQAGGYVGNQKDIVADNIPVPGEAVKCGVCGGESVCKEGKTTCVNCGMELELLG